MLTFLINETAVKHCTQPHWHLAELRFIIAIDYSFLAILEYIATYIRIYIYIIYITFFF